ncbi:MAG TPA: patatin-like phospholipase family protein, partial [Allosphingosinicella sp.]|nr:patatin-like phospholipase family protein [Allosphingosinicella sp.]
MRFTKSLAILSCALLAGCAHDLFSVAAPIPTPPGPRCDFVRYRLDAEPPHALMKPASVPQSTVAEAVEQRVTGAPGAPPKMLFMSGGSQHGAFGAGLLDEWRILAGGTLPHFKVVTGISTGSILATFAFTGDTDVLVGREGYGILREGQLLTPYLDNGDVLRTAASIPNVLKHGAVADLAPLRQQLMKVIDAATLHKVALGAAEGRLLMVGAVDVDAGTGIAF